LCLPLGLTLVHKRIPTMALKIQVIRTFDAIRVMFNDIIHLHIVRSDLVGMQAWIREPESRWYIEYTFRNGAMIQCDYDSEEKWRGILEQMKTAL
jgi:hypothetical protein